MLDFESTQISLQIKLTSLESVCEASFILKRSVPSIFHQNKIQIFKYYTPRHTATKIRVKGWDGNNSNRHSLF